MTRPGRSAFSVLGAVLVLAFAAGVMVMAFHTLWRGSSRNLFSLQEHRQLMNIGRSAVAEAMFAVQTKLEQGHADWLDWCTLPLKAGPRTIPLDHNQPFVQGMTQDPRYHQYTVTDVTVTRVAELPLAAGQSGRMGAIDFTVTASVERHAPTHRATLKLTERHAFWFSDAPTPFPHAVRHIAILPTPAATFLEFE
jgi:hypothetical protein